ncbi:hypothetical protein EPD60_16040 [Flaviaesturariibacter flavus]|uniref:Uncharacterized protein n=1 Tax=Flaviaesturariibacter flavus TaxID=2502780 RepID=A0A4V2NV42_9BACT|nr:hypothetical protein [Flaviaesturariibacter flavus]TCJ12066.1 hypothetical protein EPD60_16040 [Flaviaesturariibacter flavus]
MEKKVKERSIPVRESQAQPQMEQTTAPARMPWVSPEVLELQEKARRYQRRYPSGGYQGL